MIKLPRVTVDSFADFIAETEATMPGAELVLYRGQPKRGGLLPSVARGDPSVDTTELERRVLAQFRLLGASLLPPGEEDELDLLVHAQHFGMHTRLLDWTTNPLAALWFACADHQGGDVFVYLLYADRLVHQDRPEPFAVERTRVFQPRYNNARIVAQEGWFTLHKFSRHARRFVALEKNPDTNSQMWEYKIPASRRVAMLESLLRHGVSSRTLFPDLGGLCQHLNRKHLGVRPPTNATQGAAPPVPE
jgi:hypothetical protein